MCDGCWVQGYAPHACQLVVVRSADDKPYRCICQVEPSCQAWRPHGDEYP